MIINRPTRTREGVQAEWRRSVERRLSSHATSYYYQLQAFEAPGDLLQDVAWLTYAANVQREEKEVTE